MNSGRVGACAGLCLSLTLRADLARAMGVECPGPGAGAGDSCFGYVQDAPTLWALGF